MNLHYLLINKILIDSIMKLLKSIKHAKFIKTLGLKKKELIKKRGGHII